MRRSGSVRLAVTAAAASAVLLLGACGGDSDEESEGGGDGGQSEETASGGGDGSGEGSDGGSSGGGDGEMEGTWTTGLESPYNVLVFTGETATFMMDSGEEVCTGPATGDTLTLVCQSGNTEFTSATFALEGDTLNVSWDGGSEEEYQRMDDAAMDQLPDLPTDLPTDVPTDLPTDLGDLEEDLENLTP